MRYEIKHAMRFKILSLLSLYILLTTACQRDHEVYDQILNESGETISIKTTGFSTAARIDHEVKNGETRTMRLQNASSAPDSKACPYDREFLDQYEIHTADTVIPFEDIMDSLEWQMEEPEDLHRVGKAKKYVCTCIYK